MVLADWTKQEERKVEIKKELKTEEEYFQIIEGLGAYMHTAIRGITKGRIEAEGGIQKEIQEMGELSNRLALELEEKFGILHVSKGPPHGKEADTPPPEGKRWYWPWYDTQKEKWLRSEYESEICSACPFSSGFDMRFQHRVPCTAWSGTLTKLVRADSCGMVYWKVWTPEQLLAELHAKAGDSAVSAFAAKKEAILERLKREQAA